MAVTRTDWMLDDRLMRFVFAGAATVIGLGAIYARGAGAIEWSLIPVALATFWVWAFFRSFPSWLMYFFGLVTPLVVNIVESDEEVLMFLVILTVAILASMEHHRTTVRATVTLTMTATFVLGITGAITSFAWPNWLFGIAFAWGFGAVVHRYSTTIAELEHARALVADQAAAHERRRIARDVHDLVGHSLSVVMLHVTGARHLVRKDPDEAERALEQAEAAGRESLAEIRRTVGMLRDDTDSEVAAVPSPDLTDVAGLVDEYLVGGVDVSYDVDGELHRVEGATALAGYRIVQEALTNVSRHTVDAKVIVSISVEDGSCELAVRNSGGTTLDLRPGSGFGLASMRERAKSVGGLLVAGPTPDGWTVEATLPVRSAEPAL